MKAKRFNLCSPVRNMLAEMHVSTVRVVDAVNAALNDCEPIGESDSKLGDSRITKATKQNPAWFKVNETITTKYRGRVNTPRLFDAWNCAVSKSAVIADFETIACPPIFKDWLNKMVEAEVPAESIPAEATAQ